MKSGAFQQSFFGKLPSCPSWAGIELDLDHPDLARALTRIHTWPLTLDVCRSIKSLDFDSDPADEIIAATSVVHRVPLMTRDRKLRRSRQVPIAS